MSEFYADAFVNDKREEKLFGEDIISEQSSFSYNNATNNPETKSNTVSFMKVEELPAQCRNILAVSECYICYSVTERKNLLRVIDTFVGDKVILRGHDHSILDLKFSLVNKGILCSVDDECGGASKSNDQKAHTIVWNRRQEQGDWQIAAQLPIRANIVRPHPLYSDIWAVANTRTGNIWLFSSKAFLEQNNQSVKTINYNHNSIYLSFAEDDGIIQDVVFSSDGTHIIVALTPTQQQIHKQQSSSFIRIYQIKRNNGDCNAIASDKAVAAAEAVRCDGALLQAYSFSVERLLALQCVNDFILTVAGKEEDATNGADTVTYVVTVWHYSTLSSLLPSKDHDGDNNCSDEDYEHVRCRHKGEDISSNKEKTCKYSDSNSDNISNSNCKESRDNITNFAVVSCIQSMDIRLPKYQLNGSSATSSSNLLPSIECALSLDPTSTAAASNSSQQQHKRYLILSSRKSNLVACLSINPLLYAKTTVQSDFDASATAVALLQKSQQQPIYHITCLDLKAPVISIDVATVYGEEHHSSATREEHLEMSCYQESAAKPGQASIQQYHILFSRLFDYTKYVQQLQPQTVSTESSTNSFSNPTSSGSLLIDAQTATKTGIELTATTTTAASSMTSPVFDRGDDDTVVALSTTVDPALQLSSSSSSTDHTNSAAATITNSTKGTTILNMLNSFVRPNSSSSSDLTNYSGNISAATSSSSTAPAILSSQSSSSSLSNNILIAHQPSQVQQQHYNIPSIVKPPKTAITGISSSSSKTTSASSTPSSISSTISSATPNANTTTIRSNSSSGSLKNLPQVVSTTTATTPLSSTAATGSGAGGSKSMLDLLLSEKRTAATVVEASAREKSNVQVAAAQKPVASASNSSNNSITGPLAATTTSENNSSFEQLPDFLNQRSSKSGASILSLLKANSVGRSESSSSSSGQHSRSSSNMDMNSGTTAVGVSGRSDNDDKINKKANNSSNSASPTPSANISATTTSTIKQPLSHHPSSSSSLSSIIDNASTVSDTSRNVKTSTGVNETTAAVASSPSSVVVTSTSKSKSNSSRNSAISSLNSSNNPSSSINTLTDTKATTNNKSTSTISETSSNRDEEFPLLSMPAALSNITESLASIQLAIASNNKSNKKDSTENNNSQLQQQQQQRIMIDAASATFFQQQKQSQQHFQHQLLKELQNSQQRQEEQLLSLIKKTVEEETKREVGESIIGALDGWKVEVTQQILKDLLPAVNTKLRDTVRDVTKSQLPPAFRGAFESALLPALEAGVQNMLQQVQGAMRQSIQDVVTEGGRRISQHISSTQSVETLHSEIRDLRTNVKQLQVTVDTLTDKISDQSKLLTLLQQHGASISAEQAVQQEDAFSLLSKGRISDAIVRVLEDKDIAVTVSLLEKLSPQQVSAECSHLEILCITQQLAADMSVNIPLEGIAKRVDWIKNLVLSLLTYNKNSNTVNNSCTNRATAARQEDPHYDIHFKTLITVVLDSISAAKRMIAATSSSTATDGDTASSFQSVCTDLQLLEFVIQSKI